MNMRYFKGPKALAYSNAKRALAKHLDVAIEDVGAYEWMLSQNGKGEWGFDQDAKIVEMPIAQEEETAYNSDINSNTHEGTEMQHVEQAAVDVVTEMTELQKLAANAKAAKEALRLARENEKKIREANKAAREAAKAEKEANRAKTLAERRQKYAEADAKGLERHTKKVEALKTLIAEKTKELEQLIADGAPAYQNGKVRPNPDTFGGKIWAIIDSLRDADEDGSVPTRDQVLAEAVAAGLVDANDEKQVSLAKSKFYAYRKFHGFTRSAVVVDAEEAAEEVADEE